MTIGLGIIAFCIASIGFGVGWVCGRGMKREAEWERAAREELDEMP